MAYVCIYAIGQRMDYTSILGDGHQSIFIGIYTFWRWMTSIYLIVRTCFDHGICLYSGCSIFGRDTKHCWRRYAAISTTQQLESLESPHFLHYSVATCDCACCPVSLRVQWRNHWLVFKSIFLLWTSHKLALGGIIDWFLSPRFQAVSTISVLTNIYYTV